jgi:hypothetical protein
MILLDVDQSDWCWNESFEEVIQKECVSSLFLPTIFAIYALRTGSLWYMRQFLSNEISYYIFVVTHCLTQTFLSSFPFQVFRNNIPTLYVAVPPHTHRCVFG